MPTGERGRRHGARRPVSYGRLFYGRLSYGRLSYGTAPYEPNFSVMLASLFTPVSAAGLW